MTHEAKFLNLTNFTYQISIIDKNDNNKKGSMIQIKQYEMGNLKCPQADNSFSFKNLTNQTQELFFTLPILDILTIEIEFATNQTVIKKDSVNFFYHDDYQNINLPKDSFKSNVLTNFSDNQLNINQRNNTTTNLPSYNEIKYDFKYGSHLSNNSFNPDVTYSRILNLEENSQGSIKLQTGQNYINYNSQNQYNNIPQDNNTNHKENTCPIKIDTYPNNYYSNQENSNAQNVGNSGQSKLHSINYLEKNNFDFNAKENDLLSDISQIFSRYNLNTKNSSLINLGTQKKKPEVEITKEVYSQIISEKTEKPIVNQVLNCNNYNNNYSTNYAFNYSNENYLNNSNLKINDVKPQIPLTPINDILNIDYKIDYESIIGDIFSKINLTPTYTNYSTLLSNNKSTEPKLENTTTNTEKKIEVIPQPHNYESNEYLNKPNSTNEIVNNFNNVSSVFSSSDSVVVIDQVLIQTNLTNKNYHENIVATEDIQEKEKLTRQISDYLEDLFLNVNEKKNISLNDKEKFSEQISDYVGDLITNVNLDDKSLEEEEKEKFSNKVSECLNNLSVNINGDQTSLAEDEEKEKLSKQISEYLDDVFLIVNLPKTNQNYQSYDYVNLIKEENIDNLQVPIKEKLQKEIIIETLSYDYKPSEYLVEETTNIEENQSNLNEEVQHILNIDKIEEENLNDVIHLQKENNNVTTKSNTLPIEIEKLKFEAITDENSGNFIENSEKTNSDKMPRKGSVKILKKNKSDLNSKATETNQIHLSNVNVNEFQNKNIKEKINFDSNALKRKFNLTSTNFSKSFLGKIFSTNILKENINLLNDTRQADIQIKNNSKAILYLRLSGEDTEVEFQQLSPHSELFFKRTIGNIFKLQYTLNQKLKTGPVYNVYSGCQYRIDKNLLLFDSDENDVSVSYVNFQNINLNNNKIFFLKPENLINLNSENFPSLNFENYITITNCSTEDLKIRIKSTQNSLDDVYQIYPLMGMIFHRSTDAEFLTELKYKTKILKYSLKSSNGYIFDQDFSLINTNTREIIELSTNQITMANNKPREDKILEKFSTRSTNNYDEDLYYKFENLNFDEENLNEFNLENLSDDDVYFRLEKKEYGQENFTLLKKSENISIIREDGLFLLEIILTNLTSQRYIIHTELCYDIKKDFNLVESMTQKLIPNTTERFSGNKLILDKINKEINYNSEKFFDGNCYDEDLYGSFAYFNNLKSKHYRGKKFNDENFPPKNQIISALNPLNKKRNLTNNSHSEVLLNNKFISSISFKRPEEIFNNEKLHLFNDNIDSSVLTYESYLSSILFALYQYPNILKRLFRNLEINRDGYYEIFYFENGEKKVMFVDDHFLVLTGKITNEEKLYFSKPQGNEIWVQLLEKAYAKYEGGYANIIDGNVLSEIQFFTGAVCNRFFTTDVNLWNNLLSANENGSIVIVCNIDQNTKNKGNSLVSFTCTIKIKIVDRRCVL